MDEFGDIEKDAETFTTALLTALILNGGKALTIKIKGKKTTVTAEAVEKCIDKDGNLDTKKLVNDKTNKTEVKSGQKTLGEKLSSLTNMPEKIQKEQEKNYQRALKLWKKEFKSGGENQIDAEHGFQFGTDDCQMFEKSKFGSGFFNKQQIYAMLNSVNSRGYMDEYTGKFIQELYKDENSIIFSKTVSNDSVDSIMKTGIRCLGSATSYANQQVPKSISEIDLQNTVNNESGSLISLVSRMKSANGVSQGSNSVDGTIIIKIPKDVAYESIFIYDSDAGCYCIDPKYNVGFVKCDENGNLNKIKLREGYYG